MAAGNSDNFENCTDYNLEYSSVSYYDFFPGKPHDIHDNWE